MLGKKRKLPRLLWPRRPVTKVKPNGKKELSRRACRGPLNTTD